LFASSAKITCLFGEYYNFPTDIIIGILRTWKMLNSRIEVKILIIVTEPRSIVSTAIAGFSFLILIFLTLMAASGTDKIAPLIIQGANFQSSGLFAKIAY